MHFSPSAPSSLPRRSAILLILLALSAAACTASTTVELGASEAAPTVAATSETLAAPDTTPAPPEPTPIEAAAETPPAQDEPVPTVADVGDGPNDTLPEATTEVVLLDPGVEPRTELRLVIAASCGEIMTVEQTQEISQTVDGFALPSSGAVGTVVEMSTSAARVGDNYETQAEIIAAYASAGVAPDVASSMNRELERLIGLATFVTVTDRGVQVPGTYRIDGAEALGPLQSAVETISQVQAPLPVEAVGVGARWKTTSVVDFEGADLMTVTEYLITAREGTLVDMQVSATQSVEIGSQMNMQGFDVEITEWVGTTTGETTLDLATISPIRSVSTTQAIQGLDFGTEGMLIQQIDSVITLTSTPDDGCTGRTTRP